MRAWILAGGVALGLSVATAAGALTLTIEQTIPVPSPPSLSDPPSNAEGVAVIQTGPNAGIYVPHRSDSLVTVLDVNSGAFLYNFNSGIPAGISAPGLRAIDVLPNGNLLIGQHTTNLVREVIIPANPGNGSIPNATFGTINFTIPAHPDDPLVTDDVSQVFDEFEALSPFVRASDGQLFVLLAEEGRNNNLGVEQPGELYLGMINSTGGLSDFHKLFSVPLGDGYDDISGIDIVHIAFDGAGAIDLGASRFVMVDDSSGGSSGAFILNLAGQVIETLAGPGNAAGTTFESLFGQPWRDAEGADFDAASGELTVWFSNGASGTSQLVVFDTTLQVPVPEPAAALLMGLGLAGLALVRRRS